MLKNKFIAIVITGMLILPVYAEPESALPATEREMFETIYPENNQAQEYAETETAPQEDVTPAPPENAVPGPYKQPTGKKKIVKKFLLAMMGVVGSSIIIFALLSIYNRVRESLQVSKIQDVKEVNSESTLETPDSLTEAVKTFLDKTKWE